MRRPTRLKVRIPHSLLKGNEEPHDSNLPFLFLRTNPQSENLQWHYADWIAIGKEAIWHIYDYWDRKKLLPPHTTGISTRLIGELLPYIFHHFPPEASGDEAESESL